MSGRHMRDVSWILKKFREALLGRKWDNRQLRHKTDLSSRSPPHPMLPDGPAHGLSANYYFKRDTRRLITPPKDYVNVLHEGKTIEGKPTSRLACQVTLTHDLDGMEFSRPSATRNFYAGRKDSEGNSGKPK